MRNHFRVSLAAALVALTILHAPAALAQVTFDATITAAETIPVISTLGGTVESVFVRTGDIVSAGDAIAEIATTKVFAQTDGSVNGIFAAVGDDAKEAGTRYGAVLYLAPLRKYTITATIDSAYSSTATKYVRLGETVYIKCSTDGTHRAEGIITAVDNENYTVETTAGELYMEESVYIYRDSGYATSSRLGKGTVSRTRETAVTAEGTILNLYVADGDEVERGELLFETISGSGTENIIRADADGIVAALNCTVGGNVQEGATALTLYPLSAMLVEFSVDEYMLNTVAEGTPVTITLLSDDARSYTGVVTTVSSINDQPQTDQQQTDQSTDVQFTACASFTPDDFVRIGMHATVSVNDGED